jgi:formylglycine-generating enzyme required for sulfatase activity
MVYSTFYFTLGLALLLGTMAKAPAGTLEVPGMHNTYLDKTEVTNALWKEYMTYVKNHPKEFEEDYYRRTFPNLELWHAVYPVDFDHPGKYGDYPVVGVNYPQVVHFCKWRSNDISQRRRTEIVYTLPTVLEYSRAARGAKALASGLYATNVDIPTFVGLCDNATEMTNLEGIAMSGYKGACLDTVFFFKAQADLGFRCKAYFK